MNYTNAQILGAVLNKWLQPAVNQIMGQKISSLPFLSGIENKIRSTGWVRPSWSLGAELAPLMSGAGSQIVEPFLVSYLSKMPDDALPQMAHSVVDKAIANGGLSLFDGNVSFTEQDMRDLKKLLDYNLPVQGEEHYAVREAPENDNQ